MKISKIKAKCSGFKIILKDGNKEIARAYLYLIHNSLHDKPFGLLEDVYVSQEKRGKGLGRNLVKTVIALAKNMDCYKLIATSRYSRPEVHQFYKKMGFKDHGTEFRIDF